MIYFKCTPNTQKCRSISIYLRLLYLPYFIIITQLTNSWRIRFRWFLRNTFYKPADLQKCNCSNCLRLLSSSIFKSEEYYNSSKRAYIIAVLIKKLLIFQITIFVRLCGTVKCEVSTWMTFGRSLNYFRNPPLHAHSRTTGYVMAL